MSVWHLILLTTTYGVLFPNRDPVPSDWVASPYLHPFHPCRAGPDSVLLTWSSALHAVEPIAFYEIQVRWPLSVEPNDYRLISRATPDGFAPTDWVSNRTWASTWSDYVSVYSGGGRQWRFNTRQITGLNDQKVFDFRVRAHNDEGAVTEWSDPVLATLFLPARKERFSIELIGTGRNNAQFSQIVVDGTVLFNRSDLVGFALAVFDRSDVALTHFDMYDVFRSSNESARLASDVRANGPDKFIAVVSGYAWEWHLTPGLAATLELYGAYYVGQWARVFANQVQPSPYADLAETASQDAFGHPYALLGYAGLGMGNGYESLQLNTGHYLATGKAERAIIRLGMYFNYPLGRYFVAATSESAKPLSHEFFSKSQIPRSGTLHNPVPRTVASSFQIQLQSTYAPYVGNIWNQVEYLMEANETIVLDEYNATNFGFEIVQVSWLPDPLVSLDPRAGDLLETELERVWGGPTARVSGINSSFPLPGSVSVGVERLCGRALDFRQFTHSGCDYYDNSTLTADVPLLRWGVGLWPGECLNCTQIGNVTNLVDFSIIRETPPINQTDMNVTMDVWIDEGNYYV